MRRQLVSASIQTASRLHTKLLSKLCQAHNSIKFCVKKLVKIPHLKDVILARFLLFVGPGTSQFTAAVTLLSSILNPLPIFAKCKSGLLVGSLEKVKMCLRDGDILFNLSLFSSSKELGP